MMNPRLIALVPLACIAGAALAQSPPVAADAARALREQEAAAAAPGASAAARREALDASLETRRQLIGATTDLAQRAALQLDQSEAIQRRLAMDGWDSTALVGILPRDTRDSLEPLARESFDAARSAIAALRDATAAIEAGRAPMPDRAAFEALLAQRERRAPLALARAALVLAGFGADAERRDLAALALGAVEPIRDPDPERDSRRLLLLGLARLALGAHEQALTDLQLAATTTRAAAVKIEASLAAAMAMLDARGSAAARAAVKAALAAEPFTTDGKPAPLAHILSADTLFFIGRREAEALPPGPERTLAFAVAFAPLIDVLGREDLGLDENQRRSVVFHRFNAVSPDDAPSLAELPAIVALAKGSLLMYQPGQFDAALAVLESITEKDSPRLRELGPRGADALLALFRLRESEAKAWGEDPRLIPAIDALRRLAREYPDSAHAPAAIANAASLAQGLAQTHENDRVFNELFASTLAEAVELAPDNPAADAWRTELARRRMIGGKTGEAIALLDAVRPDSVYGLYARIALAQTSARAALMAEGPNQSRLAADALARADAALARIAAERANPAAAAPDSAAPNLDKSESTITGYRAAARFILRDFPGALDDATRAVELARESKAGAEADSIALQTRARAEAALGRDDAALDSLAELLKYHPAFAQTPALELCDAATLRISQAERARDADRALAIARESLLPAARLGLQSAVEGKTGADDAWKVQLAEALCRAQAEPQQAVDLLEEVMARRGPDDRTLMWLAEARLAQNDSERAIVLLRELIASIEQKKTENETAWRAWSRILPLIAAAGPTTEQAQSARQRIALLRLKDPSLGGEPFTSRINDADIALAELAPAPAPK